MQLQDDGTTHAVETPQSTMFVLYSSARARGHCTARRISLCSVCCCQGYSIYCYDLLCLAETHVAAFTGGAYIQLRS